MNKIKTYIPSHIGKGYLAIVASSFLATVNQNAPLWFFFAYATFGCLVYGAIMEVVQFASRDTRHLWIAKQHLIRANIFIGLSHVAEFIKADRVADRLQSSCESALNKAATQINVGKD